MTGDLEALDPDASLDEAAGRMAESGVDLVPITETGRLVGVITSRDIVLRAVARGWDTAETTVEEIMTPDVVQCRDDEDAEEAARLMARRGVRRLLVRGPEGELAGLVTSEDLRAAGIGRARESPQMMSASRRISRP